MTGTDNGESRPTAASEQLAREEELGGEREVRSEDLLGTDRVLVIRHAGQRYRLIVTRNGRLMLQK